MKTYTKTEVTQKPLLDIRYDIGGDSPRDWTNLGHFITVDYLHRSPDSNKDLEDIVGDTGDLATSSDDHIAKITEEIEKQLDEKVLAIYPVTKYDHSRVSYSLGITMGFDNSNNGFYIITEKSQKEMGTKEKDFRQVIESEIDTYNKFINGEIFSYILYNDDGDMVDSCGGFYALEDIREQLPSAWKDEDLEEYLIQD